MKRDPIWMDCPGGGGEGNLSDGVYAQCRFCNDRLALVGGRMPSHQTPDIMAMIRRGDFG